MYGNTTSAAGAAILPVTGLALGSWLLIAVGLVVAGITLVALARRSSKVRP